MKRKKKATKTEKNTTLLRKMCDRLWSRAVRADFNGRCAVCGKQATDAHHLVPRQFYATRHDINNGIALCQYDHIWNKKVAPHQNPSAWQRWLEEHHPSRVEWCRDNDRPAFKSTKNAAYYISVIRDLAQYLEPEEVVDIIGVRFSVWLAEQEVDDAP